MNISYLRKFINKEMIANTTLKFGSMGIGLLMIRFFAGKGELDIWGGITLVIAYSSMIAIFTQFGQGTFLLKQDQTTEKLIGKIQTNSFILSIIPSALGILFYESFDKEFTISLMAAPVYVWYRNYIYYYQRKENNKYIFSFLNQNAFINFTLFAVVLALYFTDIPVREYPIYALALLVLPPVIYHLITFRKNISEFNVKESKNILSLSLPFFILAASSQIMNWTDSIMLNQFIDKTSVGLYSGILKISALVTLSLSLMNAFVAPRVRAAYKEGGQSLESLIKPYNRLGFGLSFASFILIAVLGPFIFEIMNVGYTEYLYYSLLIMSLGYLINSAVGSVGLILQLTGYASLFNKIMGTAVIFNVIANAVLIPLYGIMGAALASTISMGFWNISGYIAVRRKLGFSPV